MEYELRPIQPGEIDALLLATVDAFQEEPHDEEMALWRRFVETERTLAAFAEGEIVATSGLLSLRFEVPGATVAMAGVTAVGVQAVHRGRGLLDRMMRGHLQAISERGEEAVSGLWASEAGLYGRWGFGLATRIADLTIRSPDARLRTGTPEARLRSGSPRTLLGDLRRAYDAHLPGRVGLLARDELAWEDAISDFEHDRDGAGRLRALVVDGAAGPAGYALFAVRKRESDGRPDDVVEVRELVAGAPEVTAALWSHLLTLSLSRTVHWPAAPEDEPLVHMLTDVRAVEARLLDGLYLRLVDLPRALMQRTYTGPLDAVLEVEDPICPRNAGRWRLFADGGEARCERSDAAPDLSLSSTELGAAYLGGTALTVLGAAGRVQEHTAGALAAVGQAFRVPRAPWSFETF